MPRFCANLTMLYGEHGFRGGEPGTDEINYPFLFAELDRDGHGGWIGCEYEPRGAMSAGLGWVRSYVQTNGAAAA